MRYFFLLLLSLSLLRTEAQHANMLLGNSYNSNFEEAVYFSENNLHTSFKPLLKSEVFTNRIDLIPQNSYPFCPKSRRN